MRIQIDNYVVKTKLQEREDKLKAELAEARSQLHTAFEWERLTGELARANLAKEELESKLSLARSRLDSDYVQLKKELAQAKAENPRCEVCGTELSQCGPRNADGEPTLECKECDLREQLAEAKDENGRLAAVCALAYEKLGWIREHVEFKDSMNVAIIELGKASESTALRDLLAPTIEILRQSTLRPITWQDDVKAELARLRSLTK